MTITAEIADLIHKLTGYYTRWAQAVSARAHGQGGAVVDVASTEAIEGIKGTLKELYWTLPRLCPYCGAEMGEPVTFPDQMGYSTADYSCRCGAAVSVAHFPPREE